MYTKFFNFNREIKLTSIDLKIIDFIEQNPNEFIDYKIKDLSLKLFCSVGVISKFCKKTGFKNYKKLQINISKKIGVLNLDILDKNMLDVNSIVKNIKIWSISSLNLTANSLNISLYEKASYLIYKSRQIFCFGIGDSNLASTMFTKNLLGFDKKVLNISNYDDLLLNLNIKFKNLTLLIVFSHTCKNLIVNQILDFAYENKIKVLLLTKKNISKKLANWQIINYEISKEFDSDRIFNFSITLIQLFITNVLTIILKKIYYPNLKKLKV